MHVEHLQFVEGVPKIKRAGDWEYVFFFPTDVASRSHLFASDAAARSHLYAYLKISSSWGHKKQDIMHMHNEKLNKAINDSMPVLLA